jgi:hypothetical protein
VIWICRNRGLFEEQIKGKVDRETKEFEIYATSRTKMAKLFARDNGRVFRFGKEVGTVKLERVGGKDNRKWRVS